MTSDPSRTWRSYVPQPAKELYRRIRLLGDIVPRALASRRSAGRAFDLARAVYRAAPASFLDSRRLYSTDRLFTLDRLVGALDRRGIAGALVECGVYRGGSASVLAWAAKEAPLPRELWLFDSFQGLPEPTASDGEDARQLAGKLAAPEAAARALIERSGLDSERIHFVSGWFDETFAKTKVGSIALLHIDADFYEPVKLCLERFYDDVSPGGAIVLDDYQWYPGCRAAVHEFAAQRQLPLELVFPDGVDVSPYFFKPAQQSVR